MSHINTAAISGNAVADPELRTTPSGFNIGKLRVAVNRRKKVNDEYVDTASFFDVEILGNFSELVARKVRKGDAITIKGRLEQQQWETDDGSKRSKVVIIAEDIDGACFYKKDDQIAPLSGNSSNTPAEASNSSSGADDDIPF